MKIYENDETYVSFPERNSEPMLSYLTAVKATPLPKKIDKLTDYYASSIVLKTQSII